MNENSDKSNDIIIWGTITEALKVSVLMGGPTKRASLIKIVKNTNIGKQLTGKNGKWRVNMNELKKVLSNA